MGAQDVTVTVLGPVGLSIGGRSIDVPSSSQRRLLAALAIHATKPVRAEWLCWVLGVSDGALRTTVARLRRTCGDDVVLTAANGYRLDASVDAVLAADELANADGDPERIERALDHWHGEALEEFRHEPWAAGDAVRLDELRSSGVESLAEALIARRRGDAAIAVIEPHLARHPFRDRPVGLLVTALALTGRRTEALRRYQLYRLHLADQAGVEPSEELRRIEQQVAQGWNGLDMAEHHAAEVPAARIHRSIPAPLAADRPIIGRQQEFSVLCQAARNVSIAGPQVVLIAGQAGIGKTSLIGTFVRHEARRTPCTVLYDRCDEFINEPFQPLRGVLGQLVDQLAPELLSAHHAACGSDLSRLLPQLQHSMPTAGADPIEDQNTARHLMFQAAADVMRRAATVQPLIVALDDIHWSAPTSVQLLVHLVRELAGSNVLFVASYRDSGEASGDHLRMAVADLTRLGAHNLGLAGLDAGEMGELVHTHLAHTTGHDVRPVVAQLVVETAGNPLFAEHLLHHWSDAARLDVRDGAVSVSAVVPEELPATIRDLVWRRVGVLGDEGRSMLTAAAVLGVDFEPSLVGAIAGLEPHQLDRLLDRAITAGLIVWRDGEGTTASFSHGLFARCLESELGERARRRLHGAAFDAMAGAPVPWAPGRTGWRAARLARHAECSGRHRDALHWATVAGDEALANLAASEAVGWYQRALDHARSLSRPEVESAELRVRLGSAAYRAGRSDGLDLLYAGAQAAESCGADQVLIDAALAIDPGSIVRFRKFAPEQLAIAEAARSRCQDADLATRARVEALFAQSLVHTGQAARRTAAAESALALARASTDPGVLARTAPDLMMAMWAPGSSRARLAVAQEAVGTVEGLGDPSLAATFYYGAFTAAVCAGDADATRRYRQRLRTVADEIAEPRAKWTAGIADAFTATMTCQFREAERIIAATVELGVQIGEPEAWSIFAGQSFVLGTFEGRHRDLLPFVESALASQDVLDRALRIAHALICIEIGERDGPADLLREALADGLETIPDDLMRSTGLLGYAIVALELEDRDAAAVLVNEVLPLAGEVSFNGITSQGPIAAYAGKLLSLLGRHEEAELLLLDALSTAEAFGWEYHRASTLLALAQNRVVAASGALDGPSDGWLAEAEALCARYGLGTWGRRAQTLRGQVRVADAGPSTRGVRRGSRAR